MKPKTIMFFSNGNTAAFDDLGRQIPELQHPWLLEYAKFLESKGIDPTGVSFELPGGAKATIFETDPDLGMDKWNWSIKR